MINRRETADETPIKWRRSVLWFVCVLGLDPSTTWLAWSRFPFGNTLLNLVCFPVLLVGSVAGLAAFAGLAMLFNPRTRRAGLNFTLACMALLMGMVGGIWFSFAVARFAKLGVAARAKPLIEAIHAFSREEGHPPSRLEDVVPRFLPSIPSTGIGSSPEFHYRAASGTNQVMGDVWAVRIAPPQLLLGFDVFFYIPSKNYPQHGYGGWIERVGDWAYVHE